MSTALFMDVHIPKAITVGLRSRGVDVLTAQEDGASTLEDAELLQRATELRRVLFTFDDDLLVESNRLQRETVGFAGLVFTQFQGHSVRRCIEDLELLAKASDPDDLWGQVVYLPL